MNNWKEGKLGTFIIGYKHGFYCVGCCWALMLTLFALGVMNIMWVMILTLFVLFEKLAYKNSKKIIALSDGMRSGIIKKGYPANKINVITNISNTRAYEEIDKNKDYGIRIHNYYPEPLDKLVIYTGAFGHVNDVNYLIKIAGAIKNINNKKIMYKTVCMSNKNMYFKNPIIINNTPRTLKLKI